MDTKSSIATAAAAVTGARHLRVARNGQDAAAAWARGEVAAIVVCDGCGSGASSEVGARLGAQLVIAGLARRLREGARPCDPTLWDAVRGEVVEALGALGARLGGDRAQVVHDHLLFTIVASAVAGEDTAVWAIGDGAYALDGDARVLGPFDDNQPPYLGYDLLGSPAPATLATARGVGTVLVATDGVAEVGLDAVGDAARYTRHPDALRRELTVLARGTERIDWAAGRVERTPARLQDDGAVAIARRLA